MGPFTPPAPSAEWGLMKCSSRCAVENGDDSNSRKPRDTLNKSETWVLIPNRRSCESKNLGPQSFRFLPAQERRVKVLAFRDLFRGSLEGTQYQRTNVRERNNHRGCREAELRIL